MGMIRLQKVEVDFQLLSFLGGVFFSRLVDFVSVLCSVDLLRLLDFFLVTLFITFLIDSVSGNLVPRVSHLNAWGERGENQSDLGTPSLRSWRDS